MDIHAIKEQAARVVATTRDVSEEAKQLESAIKQYMEAIQPAGLDPLVVSITVFILACFVGYYVVWRVTPALHSPLMSVTNAISSVIIVGALIAAGAASGVSATFGFLGVILAAVNIFGGFIVTQRMLAMFSKNK